MGPSLAPRCGNGCAGRLRLVLKNRQKGAASVCVLFWLSTFGAAGFPQAGLRELLFSRTWFFAAVGSHCGSRVGFKNRNIEAIEWVVRADKCLNSPSLSRNGEGKPSVCDCTDPYLASLRNGL